MNSNKTKITIENESGQYSVCVEGSGLRLDQIRENLLIPVLLSVGYRQESICKLFSKDGVTHNK